MSRDSAAPVIVIKAVPLPPTTVGGAMVHLVVPSDPGTLQVRATSELNPPTAATVRLSVIAVPLGIDNTGLATVSVKLGATTLTITGICSVWVRLSAVAVIVTEPVVADEDAFTVSVLVTAEVEVIGDRIRPERARQPRGSSATRNSTLPVNPCTGVTVIVSVVLLPVVTVSVLLPEVSWKSGIRDSYVDDHGVRYVAACARKGHGTGLRF